MELLTGLEPEKIAFAGDWHCDPHWATAAIRAARQNGADALIQVGDFGFDYPKSFLMHVRHALEKHNLELFFVEGNHDDWGLLNHRWPLDDNGFRKFPYGGRGSDRIHYIPRGHRWQWHGKTYMGLGGAVSVDRHYRVIGQSYWPEETITMAQAEYAAREGQVDVMICHDICGGATLPNLRKSSGWPEDVLQASQQHRDLIQMVVDEVKPELFVHGHFHASYSQNILVGNEEDSRWMRVESLDKDYTLITRHMLFVNAEDLSEYRPIIAIDTTANNPYHDEEDDD